MNHLTHIVYLCFEYTNVKTAPCNTEEHFVVIRHREALYGKIAATRPKSLKQQCLSVHVPSKLESKNRVITIAIVVYQLDSTILYL